DGHFDYTRYHESTIGDSPSKWESHLFTDSEKLYFNEGENVIAVEIHQTQANSSDIVLGAYLISYEDRTQDGLADNANEVCSILSNDFTIENELKQNIMELWLDVVSSQICYNENIYKINIRNCPSIQSDSIDELLSESEYYLINQKSSEYSRLLQDLKLINKGFCLDCQGIIPPNLTDIRVLEDYKSIYLEWDEVLSEEYMMFYSTNLTLLNSYIDLDEPIPDGIYMVSNITNTSWIDYNAYENITRYYKVAARYGKKKAIGNNILGKHTYIFKGNSSKRSPYYRLNYFSIPFDISISSRYDFLDKCTPGKALRVHTLERDFNEYRIISQEFDRVDPNFNLTPGKCYQIEVANDCNLTVAGSIVEKPISMTFYSGNARSISRNTYFRTTWVGLNYMINSSFSAESLLSTLEDQGLRIYTLLRDNSNSYNFKIFEKDISSDFSLEVGRGYSVEVNEQQSGVQVR
ncbi:hypothetical protein KY321_02610, partial [Candidatus Woesearchaeota archaeon]|nr:hypothetical protein [Candidatus Woesearchaeota archaeon]